MVTPFGPGGELDLDAARRVARWLADHGSDALVVTGTTGEAPVLSDSEKADLWRAVVEAVTIPVIAGAGTNDTAHSVRLASVAEEAGAAGVLAVTPYYNRPSQAGIAAHFRAVAAATRLPVMLYDIPVRSGRKIAPSTLLGLARDVANIVAVKDAAGDLATSAQIVSEAPGGFELYSGEDPLTLPLLAVGAAGAVGVVTHWAGAEVAEMIRRFTKGDVEAARAINARLIPSYAFYAGEDTPNPLPAKAAMRALGLDVGQCRPPMGPAPDGLDEAARRVIEGLAVMESIAGSPP